MTEALSDREVDVLAFERLLFVKPGSKDQAVRDRFGLPMTRYLQVLNALLDRPEAAAHDPMTVLRLRRIRDRRPGARYQPAIAY